MLIKMNVAADTLARGAGYIMLKIAANQLTVVDSWRFIRGPLQSFHKRFHLRETKGQFPFQFLTPNHFNYMGPYPDISYYRNFSDSAEAIASKELFLKKMIGQVFDCARQLVAYCRVDVDLLAYAVMIFTMQSTALQQTLRKSFPVETQKGTLNLLFPFSGNFCTLGSYAYVFLPFPLIPSFPMLSQSLNHNWWRWQSRVLFLTVQLDIPLMKKMHFISRFASLKLYALSKERVFSIPDEHGYNRYKTSYLEFLYLTYIKKTREPNLQTAFDSPTKMPRFCGICPDGVVKTNKGSYRLYFFHGGWTNLFC